MHLLADHMLGEQMADCGWNCRRRRGDTHASFHTTSSALEGLTEYARAFPSSGRPIMEAMERGCEFLLEHKLYRSHRTGEVVSSAMTRFAFPPYWQHDVLRALDHFVAADAPRDERAQDAVQQAFLLAWRDLPSLRNAERFGPWLHRLLVNACYEEARRHRRWAARVRALPVDGMDLPANADPAISIHDRDALERAFAQLSPEHRAVVVLHHHVGLPLPEIAEIVRVPVGTVKSRLFYATRALRVALESAQPTDRPTEVPA